MLFCVHIRTRQGIVMVILIQCCSLSSVSLYLQLSPWCKSVICRDFNLLNASFWGMVLFRLSDASSCWLSLQGPLEIGSFFFFLQVS
ncbi:hypothetical protein Y032_0003g1585 [Ancylostoma ceylanicum]|uniref:Uncharacterized protein n=1 Tax=Ancylostoma ceylanicum TaxID=53326 RepID=A0A016W0B4_9BILA|nr:hypothetical protein Y032_0003g1585 [Ancylostoma ceylanicum]